MWKKALKTLLFILCLLISWFVGYAHGSSAEHKCYEDLIASHPRFCEAFTGKNLGEFEFIELENGIKNQ